MQYVKQLQNDIYHEEVSEPVIAFKQQASNLSDEDRSEKALYGNKSGGSSGSDLRSQADSEQDEMINLYSCSFTEFAQHMSKQYGEQQF